MDPNMTNLTPQQLAQLLPGHLTTGANGQPVTVLLDYGPGGQQQIQLQTLPMTSVMEPSRKAPAKKPQSGKNVMDATLDDTIDQVVGHQQPLYVFNPPNGAPLESSTTPAAKVPPKRRSRAKAAIVQSKNSGQVMNVRPITPPTPPIILPSPVELAKKIEERKIRRKENVSKEFDILLDSLTEEDCEKPFTSKSDCIQRVLPFAFFYEPEMSQNLIDQFDHELLRHSVSIMERRNKLETTMRSILFRDALGKDAYNHELSMLLHLDCEYERRTLTREKELAAQDPSSFVPDPYLLQSSSNPTPNQENHQQPSTSSIQTSITAKIPSPAIAMDFDYHDFDPQDYLNRIFNLVLPASPKTPSPLPQPSSEDEEEIVQTQDPEPQTSSQLQENQHSEDSPTKMASPPQENGLQHILETHYMKSPELFTNFNLQSPDKKAEEVEKWQEESAQEVFSHVNQVQNHDLVGINQVFGGPEAVEHGTSEASTSQSWSFEHNSLSHLPPKLRLTRARLQLPLVQALDTGSRSLNEREKLRPLEQSVEMTTVLSDEAGKKRLYGMDTSDGDDADENLRGLHRQLVQEAVERRFEEVEDKAQAQQECKLLPLKIKLNRKPLKSPLSNNTGHRSEKRIKRGQKAKEKEEKREKRRLKHLQQSTSDAQEDHQTLAETSINGISSPSAPTVSLIPASLPPTSPIASPIKRRRPCWESCSNPKQSSPPKLPPLPKKLSPPVETPVNGLKLRISKVLLSSKIRKKRHREVVSPQESVDLVDEPVDSIQEPVDLPLEQVALPMQPAMHENGKHHHRNNGSKKKKKREHRKREEMTSETLPVTGEEEKKPMHSLKIPKLKIKMMHKEGTSTSSSSEIIPSKNHQRHNQDQQSTSLNHPESNLTLRIRPLKPPSSKATKKVSPKNHALSENRPMTQNPIPTP